MRWAAQIETPLTADGRRLLRHVRDPAETAMRATASLVKRDQGSENMQRTSETMNRMESLASDDGTAEEHAPTYAARYAPPKDCESTAYDDFFSTQYMDFLKTKGPLRETWSQFRPYRWLLLFMIGLITGLIAVTVEVGMQHLEGFREDSNNWIVGQGVNIWQQYFFFAGVATALGAVAGVLVCYVEVLAAGSGIPEIKCHLNGIWFPNVVGVRALFSKAVGIVFSVSSGLFCGKEGPMIHSGAIVGAIASSHKVRDYIEPLNVDVEIRDMIAAGAAAGVSAAFGAPMGGVLFAIEEGASHMNPMIMLKLFVSCASACLVTRLIIGHLEGHLAWGTLGYSVPVSFGRFDSEDYFVLELFVFGFMGFAGGLMGAFFNYCNYWLSAWRKANIGPKGTRRFLEVLVLTFVIASLSFWIPVLHHYYSEDTDGDIVKGSTVAHTNSTQNSTHTGLHAITREQLTQTEQLFWSPLAGAMKNLFHEDHHAFDLPLLGVYACFCYVASCLTYGLGVPSGLFVPSLLTGAAFGRFLRQALPVKFLAKYELSTTWAPTGIYAFIGATSMLAGTARITISLAMILVEVTGNANFTLPIFLAVMIAKWTGDFFIRGIYDMHIIDLKKIPLLESEPERHHLFYRARDLMSDGIVGFEKISTAKQILDVLNACKHHAFPVSLTSGKFLGLVERNALKIIIAKLAEEGLFNDSELRRSDSVAPSMEYEETRVGKKTFEADDPGLAREIDLLPYTNTSCYYVHGDMVAFSCYKLFRQLGLRHLPVVTRRGNVKGMITRKDLILVEDEHGADYSMGSAPDLDDDDDDEVHSDDDEDASPLRRILSDTTFTGLGGVGIG